MLFSENKSTYILILIQKTKHSVQIQIPLLTIYKLDDACMRLLVD